MYMKVINTFALFLVCNAIIITVGCITYKVIGPVSKNQELKEVEIKEILI